MCGKLSWWETEDDETKVEKTENPDTDKNSNDNI